MMLDVGKNIAAGLLVWATALVGMAVAAPDTDPVEIPESPAVYAFDGSWVTIRDDEGRFVAYIRELRRY